LSCEELMIDGETSPRVRKEVVVIVSRRSRSEM
jgi:hypothetical protein